MNTACCCCCLFFETDGAVVASKMPSSGSIGTTVDNFGGSKPPRELCLPLLPAPLPATALLLFALLGRRDLRDRVLRALIFAPIFLEGNEAEEDDDDAEFVILQLVLEAINLDDGPTLELESISGCTEEEVACIDEVVELLLVIIEDRG
jgi:hypothetical protein